ncbi:MAG: PorP/SprF family type IX secretion system membrane protein [Bacteroidota bacterium]
MIKYLLFILMGISVSTFAQDFHFSQISETPLLINPASTGIFNGSARFQINHRNQWLGANTQFMTSSLAADINLLKEDHVKNAHLGIGMFLYNDIGGDSQFGLQSGSVSISGILPINSSGHQLSAGIQSGFVSRKSDLTRVNFENQWNGTTFDPLISSGEPGTLTNFRHFDASAGIMYQYDGGSTNFRRTEEKIFRLGASIYHANNTRLEYIPIVTSKLYRKFVFHTSYTSDFANSDWAYDLSLVQFFQGPHHETIFGATFKNRLQSGTKITGFYQDAYFGFGLYTRWKDAIIPRVFIDFRNVKFGVSYDVTISQLRKVQSGSIEFSLSYANLNRALFKRK